MPLPEWYDDVLESSRRLADLDIFFIVGCQKSGTTWLEKLLAGHPNVACRGEAHLTDVLTPLVVQAAQTYHNTPKATGVLETDDIWGVIRLLADRILSRYVDEHPEKTITAVGDKTPEAAMALDAFDRLYPDAKFIHIIRDGRDGAVSGWAQLTRQGEAGKFPSFADYAEYFARSHWAAYISRARQVGHTLPGRFLEVRYERLHHDDTTETRRVLDFLGLDAGDDVVAACREAGSFERLSGGRPRGQEAPGSHFRKGIVGDWRHHFDDEASRRFEAGAGELLAELGYLDPALA